MKMCSVGGWQTEKGNMKMDFRRKLSDNKSHTTRTQTTRKFQACFCVLNQWEPFSGVGWKGSTWHSGESLHLGQWMLHWMPDPCLSFTTCRDNPLPCISSGTSGFYYFWMYLAFRFPWTKCSWLYRGKEMSASLFHWESGGAQARFVLSFLSLFLTCESIFTLSCPDIS